MVKMLKSILLSFLCLIALIISANAAVFNEMYFKDPAHPGKCKILNNILTPGQSIKHPVMKCAQFTCDNAQGMATIESCDPIHALPSPLTMIKNYDPKDPPTCKWGDFSDTSKPYPECCKRDFSCVL